jgi:hypothetical protein
MHRILGDNRKRQLTPGASSSGAVHGDVATDLFYVAEQFNLHVENLDADWCWGYAYRPIRGQTTGLSNHASGTAIDLNAPSHPLAKVGTLSSKEQAEIEKILDFCEGVVRWGGKYSGRKDEDALRDRQGFGRRRPHRQEDPRQAGREDARAGQAFVPIEAWRAGG